LWKVDERRDSIRRPNLVSGFRWNFYEISDVEVRFSLATTLYFLFACLAVIWWIFRTGYRLKN
jgi:ABC-2 type transport system permease protein